MALKSPVDVRSESKEQRSIDRQANGDLRIKLAKMCENGIDNYLINSFDKILVDSARQITYLAGMKYEVLCTADRLLLNRFRCPLCGVLPLYFLDLKHLNKVRCGKCSMIIALKNSSGKYGKIRKKIAVTACEKIDKMLSSN